MFCIEQRWYFRLQITITKRADSLIFYVAKHHRACFSITKARFCVCVCGTPPAAFGPFWRAKSLWEAYYLAPTSERGVSLCQRLALLQCFTYCACDGTCPFRVTRPVSDPWQRSRPPHFIGDWVTRLFTNQWGAVGRRVVAALHFKPPERGLRLYDQENWAKDFVVRCVPPEGWHAMHTITN